MIRILFLKILIILFCSGNMQDTQFDFVNLRKEMVNKQIAARGITKRRILNAFQTVERHLFVPEELIGYAYDDHPLSIGEGQTISQPYIVALMTDILNLKQESRVLEIGTGSGYQAAILGEIVDEVYTIEIVNSLYKRSSGLLKELGYDNIICKYGDGYLGWEDHAPYDAIIVTCAPSEIPEALSKQLAEGGRMIIPVGENYVQELLLLEKKKGSLRKKRVASVLFVPMLREDGKRYN